MTVAGSTVSVSSVTVSGSAVTLTLATPATDGQAVTITYVVPSTDPVQDTGGADAAPLNNHTVTNNTPSSPPTLRSATVDGATLTLTYNEELDEMSTPPTSAYTVTVAGSAVLVSTVTVSGSAVTLTLATPVQAGQTVTLAYAAPGTNPVQDDGGLDAGTLSSQGVTNLTAAVPPALRSATVDGATLTLIYNEALDPMSRPATSTYTVTVGGATVSVSAVTVIGSTVTLTLATPVQADQAVTLSYAVPGNNPVQDVGGTDAVALINQAVTNYTGLPVLTPKNTPFHVTEGNSVDYTVTLSFTTTQAVSVAYATSSGTAEQGTDFSAESGILTIPAGQTERSFTLQTIEDA